MRFSFAIISSCIFLFLSCAEKNDDGINQKWSYTLPPIDDCDLQEPPIIKYIDTGATSNLDSTTPFSDPEIMPQPQYDVNIYISENLDYSTFSANSVKSTKIIVKFIVKENGVISDIKVVNAKNHDDELVTEIIKIFQKMPDWKPGMIDGENVDVPFTLPIIIDYE